MTDNLQQHLLKARTVFAEPFVHYLLMGFELQALETKNQLFDIMALFDYTKRDVKEKCRGIYSGDLMEVLFSYPIVTPVKLASHMDIHYTTATRYLKELEKNGFLVHQKLGKYQLYANKRLLKTVEGHDEQKDTEKK